MAIAAMGYVYLTTGDILTALAAHAFIARKFQAARFAILTIRKGKI